MKSMRKHTVVLGALLAVAIAVSSASYAYVLLSPARRWFNADTPRMVNVDNRGVASVTGADPDHGVTASVNAVTAWNSGGVNVTASRSGNVAYVLGDGVSDVIFADPLHICTGSCLAATTTGYYNTGATGTCGGLNVVRITDSDVAFNLNYNYTTVAQGSCSSEIYLESVLTHEVGHVIGLAHSNQSAALMYATVSYCSNKKIASDDTAGRDALYNCSLVEGGGGGGCKASGQACATGGDCCSGRCKGNGLCR